MPITGYYDGTVVRTDTPLKPDQKVLIVPIDDSFFELEGMSAAGMLHEYAHPDLIPYEKYKKPESE